MKTTFYTFVLITVHCLFINFCIAQTKDSLIQISPEIRDTISLSERNYYGLFPGIKDFQFAMMYLSNDTIALTKINYHTREGILADTIITNSASHIGNFKARIRQMNADRLENYESGTILTVTKLGGNKFSGKLLAVQDSSVIICSDSISSPNAFIFLKTYVRLNTEEVESVFFEFDSKPAVIWGAFIGSIIGLAVGVVVGSNQPEDSYIDPSFGLGFTGTALGALAGAGVGYLLSPADQIIEINSAADLELLKKYILQ
jgi:hypothetical protein